jgi:uncharacterized protein YggE
VKSLRNILFILAISFYVPSSMAQILDSPRITKSISTSGSAKIWITPDRARLFLGVETLEPTIDGARQKNASTINQIMKILKSLRLKDIYVQSPTYNVTFVKEDEYNAKKQFRLPRILGYKVTQKFTVLLKNDDITTLSKNASLVLDTALQNGVNIIEQDIMFFKEDISQKKKEALKLAIKDAISRAKVIAETAGVSIKEYSMISSGFYLGSRYDRYSQVSQVSSPVSSEGTASTLIAAKIPVEASVSLNCILE